MPTQKQLAEMDRFMNTTCHDDYDYDWLCPHDAAGCNECWGDPWLQDWADAEEERDGVERDDVYRKYSSEERTWREGDDDGADAVSPDGMGTQERRNPYLLLPLESMHGEIRGNGRSRRHGRRRLGQFNSWR